jgi:hypothetical protein
MVSSISPTLIYQSIKQDFFQGNHPEYSLFHSAWQGQVFYEAFMPTDRSSSSAWGMTTLANDSFPNLSIPCHDTFEEVTDRRASELAKHVDSKDLPIVVCWSGGIDSTVILASLVKNWPKCLLDRVHVKMSRGSYFENPWFFDKIIAPAGFKIQNSLDRWEDYFVFTGNCADSLWVQADIVELEVLYPGSSQWSMTHRKDFIIQWLTQKSSEFIAHQILYLMGNELFVPHRIYDMVVESSIRSGVDLVTIEDFYWWWNFNFVYTGQLYKYINDYKSDQTKIDLATWHHQHLGWYHNDEYQLWSAWNRSNGIKINGTVRSYKWPAKQYIYDVDGNHWYRDYKTKIGSSQKNGNYRSIKALYSDGTLII